MPGSLNIMKLVYKIYIPSQWRPLYNMRLQKQAAPLEILDLEDKNFYSSRLEREKSGQTETN